MSWRRPVTDEDADHLYCRSPMKIAGCWSTRFEMPSRVGGILAEDDDLVAALGVAGVGESPGESFARTARHSPGEAALTGLQLG